MTLNKSTIKKLLNSEESGKIEFKVKYDLSNSIHKKNIVRDICAMGNYVLLHGGKGYLIIGYDNKKQEIIGIKSKDYNKDTLQQIVTSNSEPPPFFKFSIRKYNKKNLGIIEISRNINGPHQWKWGGFPIRRESITGFMTTSEIKYLLNRSLTLTPRQSEYDLLSKNEKKSTILSDVLTIFDQYEQINNRIIKYKGTPGKHYPCDYASCSLQINKDKYTLFLCVNDRGHKNDLFRLHFSQVGFKNNNLKDIPVFINLFTSNISPAYFNDLRKSHSMLVKTKVSNKTTYFGIGKGVNKNRISYSDYYIPNFYIYNIKSFEEIRNHIMSIIEWIKINSEFYNQTYNYLFKEWNITQ